MDEAEYDPVEFQAQPRKEPAKLYLISPQEVGGSFPDRLKAALEPGIAADFQLRVKDIGEHELARLAEPLQRICADADVAFIVNDSMKLAKRLGADGVHLGQRYEVGQEFKDHADFFYIDQPYWAQYGSQGGQRTWTAMVYLNEALKGGATGFRLLGMRVEPRIGRILIWNNMAMDGSPNPWTLHSGEPVEEGIKYIVTKWYRERHFV